jgi:hypothetical protein
MRRVTTLIKTCVTSLELLSCCLHLWKAALLVTSSFIDHFKKISPSEDAPHLEACLSDTRWNRDAGALQCLYQLNCVCASSCYMATIEHVSATTTVDGTERRTAAAAVVDDSA